ncbi:probable E3 ubiquitin-protein ligase RNF217 [Polypterus senegalus]|uniref:probable E3 ubiquitin-protein ligase RNF217 n=1 Tax=Polypterus senegalus TaxID=55291 RepID=UPI0019648053|nr:probable E3 ubiquitin-protein ligase RNF217 [Polypterus senegalus]
MFSWLRWLSADRSVSACQRSTALKVKTPCGHIINSSFTKAWVTLQVDQGDFEFFCPLCHVAWPWMEIKQLSVFTAEEIKAMEGKKARMNSSNTLLKKCPGCKSLYSKENLKTNSIICRPCSTRQRKIFSFCSDCQQEWKGTSLQDDLCGNQNCYMLSCLLSCPLISEPGSRLNGCPSFRACPQCFCLIAHSLVGCPKVICPECNYHFCFRCLKTYCAIPNLILFMHPEDMDIIRDYRCIKAPRQTAVRLC